MPTSSMEPTTPPLNEKHMKLRYAGTCRLCSTDLPARMPAIYERDTKTVRCVQCPSPDNAAVDVGVETPPTSLHAPEPPPTPLPVPEPAPLTEALDSGPTETTADPAPVEPVSGVAGSSARREYERCKAKDEARLRQKWGRLGGIAVALADERQTTKAWQIGAVGEERLAARLDGLASDDVVTLHDLQIPRTRANIDHVVITRSGVWVIDAKHYQGRPDLKVEGGLFKPKRSSLVIGRRDGTKLVDGVHKQLDLVREVIGDTPVKGALCFVGADWPLFPQPFRVNDVLVVWPRRLAKLLQEEGSGAVDVLATRNAITARFKPA